MHVFISTKRLQQGRILREMGHDAQLYLGVIGGENMVILVGCDESLTDFLAELGAHGNILQVGPTAGQPASGRHGLVKRCVDTLCSGVYHARQGIYIGGFQLHQLAVIQKLPGQSMLSDQLLQNLLFCGISGLGSLDDGQIQLLEQNYA
jgi:hypothetical protein